MIDGNETQIYRKQNVTQTQKKRLERRASE
jgi:hypothetical protein